MRKFLLTATAAATLLAGHAEARITRLELSYGEVDPNAPGNAIIQDIALASKNARGMVAYVSDIDMVRPADPARGNHVLLLNVVNHGN